MTRLLRALACAVGHKRWHVNHRRYIGSYGYCTKIDCWRTWD